MSYLQRKTNYAHGVSVFLDKHGFNTKGRGHRENKIMVEFLKEMKLPYVNWNWNYKGLNTAELINAETVQDHWPEFRKWVLNKVELRNNKE